MVSAMRPKPLDIENFQNLVVDSLPRLRAHAIALARNPHQADDLIQETVIRALKARHQFATGTNFSAWIHRILHNQYINVIRQYRRLQPLDDIAEHQLATDASQHQHLTTREVLLHLRKLPTHQREAMVLVCGNDMSYEETALLMDCSVGTVKSRVWRARQQMKKLFVDDSDISILAQ